MKVWVIGRGGLLGGGVENLSKRFAETFLPNEKFMWSERDQFQRQISESCELFSQQIVDSQWVIFWCAGRGTMSSNVEQMLEETKNFEAFLESVEKNISSNLLNNGLIFYASSAGGVYALSKNQPFTELTAPLPASAYGVAKLAQEDYLREFSDRLGVRILVGRISNLYGTKQDLSKNQGLISTICFSILRRQPINLFVPLETSRDYVYVADAARIIVESVKIALTDSGLTRKYLKLVVSNQNLTVGNILNIARSIVRVKPLVTVSSYAKTNQQPRSLNFKSVELLEADLFCKVGFSVGIKKVMTDLQAQSSLRGFGPAKKQ